ncbi:MAG TPA: GTP-binding protein, partial [Acetobacteraceae bacterium]|nr:GTP-binding protein [Acetobacteraceae bacterium]
TGFLGSGKTTFLRRVLAAPAMAETAVVINEFGEVGLDHLLVEASPDDVVQLPGGCLCCAVRQDLVRTLHRLLARRAEGLGFRRVVIETSGLAEPAPILATLAADPYLERELRLAAVLTLVDAVAGLATLDRYAEATAQAVVADRLLLTKTDLAPPPASLTDRLLALNPSAEIEEASALGDPARALFAPVPRAGPRRRLFAAPASHTHGIGSFALALRRRMSRLEFARALGGLARERGEDLLRVKGIVAFADATRPAAIHAVRHTLYPPDWLDAWPEEAGAGRLVFITRGIGAGEVLARFAAGDPALLGVDAPGAVPDSPRDVVGGA